jgi:hypothetical protein
MDVIARRRNLDPWWGLLLALGALLCNAVFFLNPPARQALPWVSVAMAAGSLLFVIRGLIRAFAKPQLYRGKLLSSVLVPISLLMVAMVGFVSVHARELPKSAGAPKIGDRAPDFTLTDTTGRQVSLSELFAPAADGSQPKAVLLVFYRGYW